jgi:hypothetical protein
MKKANMYIELYKLGFEFHAETETVFAHWTDSKCACCVYHDTIDNKYIVMGRKHYYTKVFSSVTLAVAYARKLIDIVKPKRKGRKIEHKTIHDKRSRRVPKINTRRH